MLMLHCCLAGYAPNLTLDATINGVSQVLLGNSGGPNFEQGNYPQVGFSHPQKGPCQINHRTVTKACVACL